MSALTTAEMICACSFGCLFHERQPTWLHSVAVFIRECSDSIQQHPSVQCVLQLTSCSHINKTRLNAAARLLCKIIQTTFLVGFMQIFLGLFDDSA